MYPTLDYKKYALCSKRSTSSKAVQKELRSKNATVEGNYIYKLAGSGTPYDQMKQMPNVGDLTQTRVSITSHMAHPPVTPPPPMGLVKVMG